MDIFGASASQALAEMLAERRIEVVTSAYCEMPRAQLVIVHPGDRIKDGVRVEAQITSLRLADIAFDSKTLRVIAESEGSINVYITALKGL